MSPSQWRRFERQQLTLATASTRAGQVAVATANAHDDRTAFDTRREALDDIAQRAILARGRQ